LPITICTVVTKSHLAFARTLATSLRVFHPDAEVFVLLADRLDGSFDPEKEPFKLVTLADLAADELIAAMAMYYTPFEFCNALKAFLHEYIWRATAVTSWIYLDSDIHIRGSLTPVFAAGNQASVLLNPHLTRPVKNDALFQTTELAELRSGVFSGGFLCLTRCEATREFISWFRARLKAYCFVDQPGLFVDQLWLNLVPNLFPNVKTYTAPGANLAHWNLFERTITRSATGTYQVDNQPLMFVHFSGWDINDPGSVSLHAPAYRSMNMPQLHVWRNLGTEYRAALLANGFVDCVRLPYAFATYSNGQPIPLEHRRNFYAQRRAQPVPSPLLIK
jgi:hypothetical protein